LGFNQESTGGIQSWPFGLVRPSFLRAFFTSLLSPCTYRILLSHEIDGVRRIFIRKKKKNSNNEKSAGKDPEHRGNGESREYRKEIRKKMIKMVWGYHGDYIKMILPYWFVNEILFFGWRTS